MTVSLKRRRLLTGLTEISQAPVSSPRIAFSLGSLEHIDLSHSTIGGMRNDYKAAKEAFVSGMI